MKINVSANTKVRQKFKHAGEKTILSDNSSANKQANNCL